MNIMNAVSRWRSGKEIPRLAPFPAILTIFTLLVCALPFGTGFAGYTSFAACAVGAAFVICMSRSVSASLCVCLPAAFMFLITESFILPAIFISAAVTVGAGAFLVNTSRSYYLLWLIPAAYAASLAVGHDWKLAFLCIIALPPVIALSKATYTGRSRLSAICRTSFAFFASIFALTVALFIAYDLSFALDMLRAYTDALRDTVTYFIADVIEANKEIFDRAGITAKDCANALLALMPAAIVCTVNYLSFAAQKINISLMKNLGFSDFVSKNNSRFIMSSASGYTFLISAAVVVLCSYLGGIELMETAENLVMILTPGLLLVGLLKIFGKYGEPRKNVLMIALTSVCAFLYPTGAILMLSGVGAFTVTSHKDI